MSNLRRIPVLLCLIVISIVATAKQTVYADTAIWQGMNLKLDLFNPLLEGLRSKGKLQTYEIALNARLKNRYYPTLELGYAFGKTSATGLRSTRLPARHTETIR